MRKTSLNPYEENICKGSCKKSNSRLNFVENNPTSIFNSNDDVNPNNDTTLMLTAVWAAQCASGVTCETVDLAVNETKDFSYTGDAQGATLAKAGYYKLEVWGAQGGTANGYRGGYGGYSTGVYASTASGLIYVYVGGAGTNGCGLLNGGYNGGGDVLSSNDRGTCVSASGGGATHISTTAKLLEDLESDKSSVLIVAGGGGGGSKWGDQWWYGIGGDGGGIVGEDGSKTVSAGGDGYAGTGGTQDEGGECKVGGYFKGKFGTAVYSYYSSADKGTYTLSDYNTGGAGGGGWYGGGGGCFTSGGGGGGSGYIGSSELISSGSLVKHMTCYSCSTSSDSTTLTYSNTTTPSSTATADVTKTGSGYARITYLGTSI